MKLVHDDIVDPGLRPVSQSDIGQDLGRAAEDWGAAVDAGIAGHHADILRPEVAAEGEELLVDQRLDRAGIDRLTPG